MSSGRGGDVEEGEENRPERQNVAQETSRDGGDVPESSNFDGQWDVDPSEPVKKPPVHNVEEGEENHPGRQNVAQETSRDGDWDDGDVLESSNFDGQWDADPSEPVKKPPVQKARGPHEFGDKSNFYEKGPSKFERNEGPSAGSNRGGGQYRRGGTRSGAAFSFQSNVQRNGFYEEDEEKDPIVSKKPAPTQSTSHAGVRNGFYQAERSSYTSQQQAYPQNRSGGKPYAEKQHYSRDPMQAGDAPNSRVREINRNSYKQYEEPIENESWNSGRRPGPQRDFEQPAPQRGKLTNSFQSNRGTSSAHYGGHRDQNFSGYEQQNQQQYEYVQRRQPDYRAQDYGAQQHPRGRQAVPSENDEPVFPQNRGGGAPFGGHSYRQFDEEQRYAPKPRPTAHGDMRGYSEESRPLNRATQQSRPPPGKWNQETESEDTGEDYWNRNQPVQRGPPGPPSGRFQINQEPETFEQPETWNRSNRGRSGAPPLHEESRRGGPQWKKAEVHEESPYIPNRRNQDSYNERDNKSWDQPSQRGAYFGRGQAQLGRGGWQSNMTNGEAGFRDNSRRRGPSYGESDQNRHESDFDNRQQNQDFGARRGGRRDDNDETINKLATAVDRLATRGGFRGRSSNWGDDDRQSVGGFSSRGGGFRGRSDWEDNDLKSGGSGFSRGGRGFHGSSGWGENDFKPGGSGFKKDGRDGDGGFGQRNSEGRDMDFGGDFGRSFDGPSTRESRKAPSNYVPEIQNIDEIFQEDQEHEGEYRLVMDQDEDIIVTGLDEDISKLDTWHDAELEKQLNINIQRSGYTRPRKIQSYAIPLIMQGYDVIGQAETGSGKTAAFLLPIINYIIKNKPERPYPASPFAIIIGSSRELALQIYNQARKFADQTKVTVAKAYGDTSVKANIAEIYDGCDILCATPGRLKSFVQKRDILVQQVKFVVFDEADKLMEESFLKDLRDIIGVHGFPEKENRQTLMFSATFSEDVQKLCREMLRDNNVMVANKKLIMSNHRVNQRFHKTLGIGEKKFKLKDLLTAEFEEAKEENPENPKIRRTLVFVQRKRDTDSLSLFLTKGWGIPSTIINGDQEQEERERALREFRAYRCPVLISTDVCARGIDIKDLDHVINMDLPSDATTYVHRVGRTGRLKEGFATSFFDPTRQEDINLAPNIVKFLDDAGQDVPDYIRNCAIGQAAQLENSLNEPNENGDQKDGGGVTEPASVVETETLNDDW
uniref:RNA helicase n=1 Tax=Acrobeloides nanus TaxID=290746 RepID=A0A914EEL8_9BILA